ncbi:MAG: maltose alpha-D-glucosyltransferase / alpha-amylase [Acidimicrobiaceae bacterium]|jgi:maltose alpha-D-glucosyltransferase/alpha-amylase|nr:maltose alpha-D-glucosyltransferase / alpha-amylase [Acidimicrobiaceae bacterium]MDQ1367254.1 maltose alpha-D-glucosyltransferase / alpha-amylase [Acidimicrobiaceae bacterium]MDQ1369150.1 maltose alpha-D-glucosyltransferase / alpha-amylase [Acidimicrobiaceae bacterium]MDQ1378611.1 maltose alpha-D-glucosyltransferase / alpha-amylase [Acidimicrobiaceae bacterium]MDQ1400819.1 maltose alpha-D-glucosyltransferase / alpha-amylase [Acidimicrobiaceae bacterium]
MNERWYKQAVIYCLDVETFQDSDGDGVGDFAGLTSRLDYLARLGVTCLWLNPIHPGPNRDDGYDVADFYTVDPRLGTLGDFAEFVHQAANRGLRVIIDLVVNHTSDQHPWFQSARSDPASRFRDWYVWSKEEPSDRRQGMVFPGEQDETWTWDEEAGAWYYHRFYNFQPDLNMANPDVRAEVRKIMAFWLQLGVSGFRMDAAPFVIELTRANEPDARREYPYLNEFRELLSWRRGDAILLAEANVGRDELLEYFGSGDRLPMMFNFVLNQRQFLALARSDATPLVSALEAAPTIPDSCQWATFLRNHDEVDLGQLSERERADCFAAFGPEKNMQLYGRGIRRRLAPMLGNDRRRLEMAYSLQFTLPGTPVLRYGEEIGMGDDLSLKERDAIRTPMQWTGETNAGFSTAAAKALCRPIIRGGDFGHETVNVQAQRRDPSSLLHWVERMLHTLQECPEFGVGRCQSVDTGDPAVLALHYEAPGGVMLALHNLSDRRRTVELGRQPGTEGEPLEMFADQAYEPVGSELKGVKLAGYGYRWIRLRETLGR